VILKNIATTFSKLFGIEPAPVSHGERLVSAVGGFIAILCIFAVSSWAVGSPAAGILVASMGASAVLLFAVPHGQLAQPWAVLGGHVISAIIGVTCAQVIANEILAASAAVGLAVGAMYYLGCIHPPGGATALSAVVGGESVHALGYHFVITPVLMNVVVILVIAVLFNYWFSWRRYPVYLHKIRTEQSGASGEPLPGEISHGDFVYALSQIDSFVDINEYELQRIYELATNRARNTHLDVSEITLGCYYSNGAFGDNWSVRQIVDESPSTDTEKDMLIYKIVAGLNRRTSGCMTRMEFSSWAKHRVFRDEENWKRVSTD
jgi:CBS-domain-containing membrane protein